MIGTTLEDIRTRIEELASETGEYHLVCARYGDRPVPAADLRFDSRATARAAARATEQYRSALRRYDPQLPYYDVIVRQVTVEEPDRETDRVTSTPEPGDGSSPEHTPSLPREDLVEFCHRVAATVFETLSENEFESVESAIMDAYFELAERLSAPDDLCLCLLESMATELDRRLTPQEQTDVLNGAAARLPPAESRAATDPVTGTLALLERRGLVDGCDFSCASGRGHSVVLDVSAYALSPQHGRLPVLPIVLDLARRQPDWCPAPIRAVAVDDGWRITLALTGEPEQDRLASAPILSGP